MLKTDAQRLLGGTPARAAVAIGVSRQAFRKWPAVLPRRLEDRVIAAWARMHLAALLAPVLLAAAQSHVPATSDHGG